VAAEASGGQDLGQWDQRVPRSDATETVPVPACRVEAYDSGEESPMKNRLMWGVLIVAVLAVAIAGINAAAKAYQFTGTVKTVTGTTFTVEKSATETWEFSTEKDTKGAPKVGDKVTVYYKMIATEIEVKPATAATKKK
jgi:hypothetical protein